MWILVSQFPFSKDNPPPPLPPHLFVSLVSLPHRKKTKDKNKSTLFPYLQIKFKPKASENLKID